MNGILRRYIEDTDRTVREVARVLAPGGQAVYVVGENTIRGTYIPTGQLVARLAGNAGLHVASRHLRDLPSNRRYLPPPGRGRTAMDTRIRREVILTLERSRRDLSRRSLA
jgi:ubiquinone/menaquinone biosynthesis C-methylase UbiE